MLLARDSKSITNPYGSQVGVTLVEILITLVIVSVGVFGIAKLQIEGLRNTQQAYYITEALMATQGMAERIRGNLPAAQAGSYNKIMAKTGCGSDKRLSCDRAAKTVFEQDSEAWEKSLSELGGSTNGDDAGKNGNVVCVRISDEVIQSKEFMPGSYCDVTAWWEGRQAHQNGATADSGSSAAPKVDTTCGRSDSSSKENPHIMPCVTIRVLLAQ